VSRRLFVPLCALVFLQNFGRVVFAPLVEPLRAAFGVGPAAIGGVVSLVWLGTALPRIPVGYVLTRVPRQRVVLATGLALSGAAALTSLAPTDSLLALRVGGFLLGATAGAYFVAAVPLVGDLYPGRTGWAVGVHGTAAQVAAVTTPGVVLVALAVASWRAVFAALAVGALALTLALWGVTRGTEIPSAPATGTRFRDALAEWPVVVTGVGMLGVAGFAWQGLFNFYVTYLTGVKGLSPAFANGLLTLSFAAGVPAFWLGGRLADRLPHGPNVAAILATLAACFGSLTVVGSPLALAVLSVVIGYAGHSLFPTLDTYMLDSLPAETRASAYAVFSGLALTVESGGSGAVGTLATRFGFDPVFRWLGAAVMLVAVLVYLTYRVGRLPGVRGGTASKA
jgi:predicted MFS family arabinose efflux permease